MSLIPSTNAGAPGQDYFVDNLGSGSAPIISAGSLSITGDSLGRAYVRALNPAATVGAPGSLHLGANPDVFDNIVLTSGPATATINGTLGVQNSIVAVSGSVSGSLDTYTNRDIHGFSDTGYVSTFVTVVGGGPVPNPAVLPQGLYSVMVVPENAGNEAAQASACCYWNGAVWTGNGVSFNFTGAGTPNVAIGPAAGGATLNIGGGAIPIGNLFVNFRQLLAAPNL